MSTDVSALGSTLPWLVRRSAGLLWGELPSALAVGAVGVVSAAPLVVALAFGQTAFAALAVLPPALLSTGAARWAAGLVRGDRQRIRDALRVDSRLGLMLALPSAAAVLLVAAGGGARVVGELIVATIGITFPFVVGYAALRRRGGASALRGGIVLAAFRPSWAITLAALGVVGLFAIVASAGVLALVIPPYLGLAGAAMCAVLLEGIEGSAAR